MNNKLNKLFLLSISFVFVTCNAPPAIAPASGPTDTPLPSLTSVTSTPETIPSGTVTEPFSSKCASFYAEEYKSQFLDAIGVADESCLPDKTRGDVGVYIYDLTNDRELIAINADTPFQFASTYKGPVLVYFLSSCRHYWDVKSPEWNSHFHNSDLVKNEWYIRDEYEKLVEEQISDVNNWRDIVSFFTYHRVKINGIDGPLDKRYFILAKVYNMIVKSGNPAASDVLQFIYDHCQEQNQSAIEKQKQCNGPNALTAFNAWFYEFSGIKFGDKMPHTGLYKLDTVLERDINGNIKETVLTTSGLKDSCVNQFAILNCIKNRVAINALTARQLYAFYNALYHLNNVNIRETTLNLLKIDEPGPARGYLKNMARNAGMEVMSKNGNAYFSYASIVDDAGILRDKEKAYIVVTLSFNTPDELISLYGSYNSNGELVGDPGLIQNLIEEDQTCAALDPPP